MKKLFRTMLATAIAAFTFTACSDVPEPYQIPGTGGGNGPVLPEGTVMQVNFQKGQNNWKVQDVNHPAGFVGNIWANSSSYGLVATAYDKSSSTNYESESWLVSPAIDLSASSKAYLAINHAANYFPSAGPAASCDVMVSTDYTEGAPSTATWEKLELSQWPSNSDFTYVDATADMSKYAGQSNVVIAFKYTSTSAKAGTWEIASCKITETEPGSEPIVQPEGLTGEGTAENPYTVADALKIIEQLGEATSGEYYIKGIVSGFVESDSFNASFGNMSYYISEDGTAANQLEIYCGYGLNGDKFKAASDLKVGDKVIVIGKLVNFKGNTPEVTTGSKLYSLNDQTAGGGTVTPTDGKTIAAGKYFFVYTATGTVQVAKPVDADKDYGYMYLTDAKVTGNKLDNDEANLFTFTAADGGFTIQDASGRYYYMDATHSSFQVSATKPSANYVWTATVASDGTATVKNVGTGKTIQYVAKYAEFTPTTSGDGLPLLLQPGDEVDANGSGQGEEPTPSGELTGTPFEVVFADLGISDLSAAIQLSDGTTLTYSQEDGKNPPVYHASTKIIRMYAHNSVTIAATGKTISGVQFHYDTYLGTAYKGNDDMYGESNGKKITPTKDDKNVTFTGVAGSTLKVVNDFSTNSGGTQFRCTGLTIYYAE